MTSEKCKLSQILNYIDEYYDLFICSSSFEDRCVSILLNLNLDKIDRVLVASNTNLNEFISKNNSTILGIVGGKGININLNTCDPLQTADSLIKNLGFIMGKGKRYRILIDITTFTHESLLILLKIIEMDSPGSIVTMVYANAAEYSVGDEVNKKWLSKGIGDIRSVLGYPGEMVPTHYNHLIVIVGYEHERAAGLIESLEPSSIALGFGKSGSSTTEKDQEANRHFLGLVSQMAITYSKVEQFELPCNDPFGACMEIETQINKVDGKNIIIAPMNNKLSTVGAALACFKDPSIQICYAQALQYNYANYSKPGDDCYVFRWKV